MIKAIIFDCFGVLVTDALEEIVQEIRQRNPAGADEIVALVRASNKGIMAPTESSKQIAALLGSEETEYRQKIKDGEVKNTALLEYVVSLRRSYKTAMLSNIGKGSLAKRFSEEELERYFDVVVASGDVGYAKPEARAYEIVAERLGVRFDECVFTDDREIFCEAARGVGMQAIVYRDFETFKTELTGALNQSGK
ncbi:MAG: HAD-IA family hydrolase [Candidatus Saccharimonadales bacterium]